MTDEVTETATSYISNRVRLAFQYDVASCGVTLHTEYYIILLLFVFIFRCFPMIVLTITGIYSVYDIILR